MNRRIVIEPEAARDLAAAVEWYEAQRPGLGAELLDAIDGALERLTGGVDVSVPDPGDPRARRILVERFPYAVVLRHADETAYVLAIAHLHRRPGFWAR